MSFRRALQEGFIAREWKCDTKKHTTSRAGCFAFDSSSGILLMKICHLFLLFYDMSSTLHNYYFQKRSRQFEFNYKTEYIYKILQKLIT